MVGSDDNKNLVLLTAREHYLCHWLLVKRNEVGSVARKKMIKAWFMMAVIGDTNRPTISKNTYAKYKEEFSYAMSESQKGHKNSQYGKHWYTNRNTGECKVFNVKPDEFWIEGRNLFRNECCYLPKQKNKKISESLKDYYKNNSPVNKNIRYKKATKIRKLIVYNINSLEKIIVKDDLIPKDCVLTFVEAKSIYEENLAKKWWDMFHIGNYNSFNAFAKSINVTQPRLTEKLRKYIPKYKDICKKRFDTVSNKNLVGVYE